MKRKPQGDRLLRQRKSQGPYLFSKQRPSRSTQADAWRSNQTYLLLILLLHGNRSHSTCSALQAATGTWQSPVGAALRCPDVDVAHLWPSTRCCSSRWRGSGLDGVRRRRQVGAAVSPPPALPPLPVWLEARPRRQEATGSRGVWCGGPIVARVLHRGLLHYIQRQLCGDKKKCTKLREQ